MKEHSTVRSARGRSATVWAQSLLALALPLLCAPAPATAETRGYVISWFATATNNPDFVQNCPQESKDPNRVKYVFGMGLTAEGGRGRYHAVVDGKPVPPLNYPDAAQEEADWEPVVGKYAYGFDLGGPEANKFIDPDTHEKADNQLWRALGCNFIFQATPPRAPYFQEEAWMNFIDSSPGWAIEVSGADLSKDGPVTVTLDRTLRHPERDALGGLRADVTYVLDPAPRSHNVLSGEIKHGVLTIQPASIYLEGDMTWYSEIDLKNAHMRMHSEPGKLVGYWGGYTDWHRWAYQCTSRPASECDGVGFYRALEKFADADPDPVTGQNRAISTTWRLEAVPAFLATTDGRVIATASGAGLGGMMHAPSVARDTAH
jgi:hypothetical protein